MTRKRLNATSVDVVGDPDAAGTAEGPASSRTLHGLTYSRMLHHPRLLGAVPAFKDLSTWQPWINRVAEAEEHGGDEVWILGRQSGKSRIAATRAVFYAVTAGPEAAGTYALLVAQDARAALRTLFRYAL
jgi:hypothetical protein